VVETFVEAVVAVEVPRKHDEDHAEVEVEAFWEAVVAVEVPQKHDNGDHAEVVTLEAVVAVEVPQKHDEDHAECVSWEETVEAVD
jgi:hypothetical protein